MTACQILSTHSNPNEINVSGWADYNIPNLTPIPQPDALESGTWSINNDVNPGGAYPPATPPVSQGSFWDEAYWGEATTAVTSKGWQNISAAGFAVALLVRFSKVNEPVIWRSTNLRYHNMGAQ